MSQRDSLPRQESSALDVDAVARGLAEMEQAIAERDSYRAALTALVEASEEFFAPNSLGAPLWPRTVDARRLLDA